MAASVRKVRPVQPPSEEQLYQIALRALGRRAHSVFELRGVLQRRTPDRAAVRRVIRRLRERNLLDDLRFALAFASYRARVKRFGRFRLARELRARGVADELIERALAQVFGEVDELATLRARLHRRVRGKKLPLPTRQVAKLYHGLLRAGFPSDIILRELRQLTKADVEELAVEPSEEI